MKENDVTPIEKILTSIEVKSIPHPIGHVHEYALLTFNSEEKLMKVSKACREIHIPVLLPASEKERTNMLNFLNSYKGKNVPLYEASDGNRTVYSFTQADADRSLVRLQHKDQMKMKNRNSSAYEQACRQKLFEIENAANFVNEHGYIDLGLSVRWATCNIGADSPEEYGDYFAWGETETKSSYDIDNCETWGKEITDIKGTSRDVAHVKWGSPWRMPTEEEFKELIVYCDWEWVSSNKKEEKITGYMVTSKRNGNSIFLPAAGCRNGTWLDRTVVEGYYWGSMPYKGDTNFACVLDFYSNCHNRGWTDRSRGFSIRPVLEF